MAILSGILNVLLTITSLFLICLILIQRGKGGGLAGAFGGMGGSSAFGTKAGDVFTRVTIYVALFWGFLAMVLVYQSNRGTDSAWGSDPSTSVSKSVDSKTGAGKVKSKGKATEGTVPDTSDIPPKVATPPTGPVDAAPIPEEKTPAKAK